MPMVHCKKDLAHDRFDAGSRWTETMNHAEHTQGCARGLAALEGFLDLQGDGIGPLELAHAVRDGYHGAYVDVLSRAPAAVSAIEMVDAFASMGLGAVYPCVAFDVIEASGHALPQGYALSLRKAFWCEIGQGLGPVPLARAA